MFAEGGGGLGGGAEKTGTEVLIVTGGAMPRWQVDLKCLTGTYGGAAAVPGVANLC